jgi:hypothetical protein
MRDGKASVLVVANRTAESEELLEALTSRAERSPAEFTLLVPSTPHGVAWAADMHSGQPEAEEHMQRAVERLRSAGLEMAGGKIGDPDPVAATEDAVNFGDYDEIVVSTLPRHVSKWLKLDLPHRVERKTGLPVTHVEGREEKAPAS